MPAANPEGFAEIVKVCGVVKYPEGHTESHVKLPLVPDALTLI